jgi:uncharacterized membrane protein YbhN (UPF0104 family)
VSSPPTGASAATARRFRPGPLLNWAGTIALGWFVLSKTDLSAVARVASHADLGLLGLAAALYTVDRITAGYRWQILYVAFGHPLGLWRATCVYLQSSFLGAALPATVGGDIIRARMVATGGQEFAHAVSSVVLERLLGTLALVVCAALGMVFLSPHASWGATVPSLAIAAAVVGAGGALIFAPPIPESAVARTGGWTRKFLAFLVSVHERLRDYAKRPRALGLSAGIGFLQQYLFMSINWLVARALGIPLSLTSVLWMWPFVMLAVRLPISFLGFGVREAVLLGFFASAGLSAESAVSLGVLSGLLDLVFIGVGGLLLVLAPPRARERGEVT